MSSGVALLRPAQTSYDQLLHAHVPPPSLLSAQRLCGHSPQGLPHAACPPSYPHVQLVCSPHALRHAVCVQGAAQIAWGATANTTSRTTKAVGQAGLTQQRTRPQRGAGRARPGPGAAAALVSCSNNGVASLSCTPGLHASTGYQQCVPPELTMTEQLHGVVNERSSACHCKHACSA